MTTQADSFCLSVYKCTDAFFGSASASHPLTAIGVTNKTNKLPVLTCWLADTPPLPLYTGGGGGLTPSGSTARMHGSGLTTEMEIKSDHPNL